MHLEDAKHLKKSSDCEKRAEILIQRAVRQFFEDLGIWAIRGVFLPLSRLLVCKLFPRLLSRLSVCTLFPWLLSLTYVHGAGM